MIYLASPYSHPSAEVRRQRFFKTIQFTDQALRRGHIIFSPIVYGHQFAESYGHSTDFRAWLSFNEHMLLASLEVWVLKLDGWEESHGVAHELAYADQHGIPVEFFDENL